MSEDDKRVEDSSEELEQENVQNTAQEARTEDAEGVANSASGSDVELQDNQMTPPTLDPISEAELIDPPNSNSDNDSDSGTDSEAEGEAEVETEESADQGENREDPSDAPSTVDVLSEIVIESAETANQAARNANESSELVISSVAMFNDTMTRVQKRQYIMFWLFIVFMTIAVSVSAVLLERFTKSALQADEIMLTVGKRVVQLDTDIKRVENLRQTLDGLTKINSALNEQVKTALATMSSFEKEAQAREEAGVKRASDQIERIANRIELKFDKLAADTQSLDARVKASEIRFAQVTDELAELKIAVSERGDSGLGKKIDTLIELQQQSSVKPVAVQTAKPNEPEPSNDECKPVLGFPC